MVPKRTAPTAQVPQAGSPALRGASQAPGPSPEAIQQETPASATGLPQVRRYPGQDGAGQGPGESPASPMRLANPEHQVEKVRSLTTEEGTFSVWDVDSRHRRPDMFTVWEHPDGWIVRNVLVPDDMQRQGIATQTYQKLNQLSVKATGHPLRSTQARTLLTGENVLELTDQGRAMWDSFTRKGMAEPTDDTYRFLCGAKMAAPTSPAPGPAPETIRQESPVSAAAPQVLRYFGQREEGQESGGFPAALRRYTREDVRAYMADRKVGLIDARMALERASAIAAVREATSLEDLKEVLILILNQTPMP